MSDTRIENMRAARSAPTVILQEYNNLRSKVPGRPILSFEGFEDTVFYGVMSEKFGITFEYAVLVCRGKDNVLHLRELLSRNLSEDANNVWYFIDHDYDGLKEKEPSENLYCTQTYSFENSIFGPDILKKILQGEFRCVGENGDKEIENALTFYHNTIAAYLDAFRTINLAIFALRKNKIQAGSIEDNLKQYASITSNGYISKIREDNIAKLVGAYGHLSNEDLKSLMRKSEVDFSRLDPIKQWRGKFHRCIFQKIISILKEDRGRKENRAIFESHAAVDANFDGNMIRSLASSSKIPSDLGSFFLKMQTTVCDKLNKTLDQKISNIDDSTRTIRQPQEKDDIKESLAYSGH